MKKSAAKLLTILFALAFIIVLGTARSADARAILALEDVFTQEYVIIIDDVDGGVGDAVSIPPFFFGDSANMEDGSPGGGIISYTGPVGLFDVDITVALSKPITEGGSLYLNSGTITGGVDPFDGPGLLHIYFTDTDFFGPGSSITNSISGETVGLGEISTSYGIYDPDNAEFGSFVNDSFVDNIIPLLGAFSDTVTAPIFVFGSPYSLTEFIEVTHFVEGDETHFVKTLSVVPEPFTVTMLLLAGGYIGLLGMRRKKIR